MINPKSVVVLALRSVLVAGVLSCAACVTSRAPDPRHVVPNTVAQIALDDFEIVSFLDVDLHTAVQTREAVESEFGKTYGRAGHPRWFFHAFDGQNLDFIVARYDTKSGAKPRYVAERRLRVKRTRTAERELGVVDVVREYEVGTRGVKAGMSRREVSKIVGRAESERALGTPGAFELIYPTFCVRFAADRAVHVWRRDVCVK